MVAELYVRGWPFVDMPPFLASMHGVPVFRARTYSLSVAGRHGLSFGESLWNDRTPISDAGLHERRGGVPAGEGPIPDSGPNAFPGAIVGCLVTTLFGMKRMPNNVVILESPTADM